MCLVQAITQNWLKQPFVIYKALLNCVNIFKHDFKGIGSNVHFYMYQLQ